jgi:hypothetical protein
VNIRYNQGSSPGKRGHKNVKEAFTPAVEITTLGMDRVVADKAQTNYLRLQALAPAFLRTKL